MPVSVPSPERDESIIIIDRARLKSPKALTVSILEIISMDKKPKPAAAIFPNRTSVRCFAGLDVRSFLILVRRI